MFIRSVFRYSWCLGRSSELVPRCQRHLQWLSGFADSSFAVTKTITVVKTGRELPYCVACGIVTNSIKTARGYDLAGNRVNSTVPEEQELICAGRNPWKKFMAKVDRIALGGPRQGRPRPVQFHCSNAFGSLGHAIVVCIRGFETSIKHISIRHLLYFNGSHYLPNEEKS